MPRPHSGKNMWKYWKRTRWTTTNGTFLMMSYDSGFSFCPQTYGLRFNEAGSPSGLPPVFRTGRHCTIRQIQIIPQNHNTTVTSSLPRHHLRYPFVTAARAAVVHVGNIVIFPAQSRAYEAGSPSGLPLVFHTGRHCTPLGVQALVSTPAESRASGGGLSSRHQIRPGTCGTACWRGARGWRRSR